MKKFITSLRLVPKGTYLGGALTLNSAVFWNAVTGMQLNKIIGLASQTFNSDVNVSGLELEAVFVPNASTQDLILYWSLQYF